MRGEGEQAWKGLREEGVSVNMAERALNERGGQGK